MQFAMGRSAWKALGDGGLLAAIRVHSMVANENIQKSCDVRDDVTPPNRYSSDDPAYVNPVPMRDDGPSSNCSTVHRRGYPPRSQSPIGVVEPSKPPKMAYKMGKGGEGMVINECIACVLRVRFA